MAKNTTKGRIQAEIDRLTPLFAGVDPDKLESVRGLIDRAAWQRVQLEDLEADLDKNGWTAKYQQSPSLPVYERSRPQAAEYQKLASNYLRTIKSLDALLPDKKPQDDDEDGFDEWMNKYRDV